MGNVVITTNEHVDPSRRSAHTCIRRVQGDIDVPFMAPTAVHSNAGADGHVDQPAGCSQSGNDKCPARVALYCARSYFDVVEAWAPKG